MAKTVTSGRRGATPVCRVCSGRVVNGNLYCSKACGQVPKEAHSKLLEAGFEPDPYTPNIYRKDGVAVTVEQVNHVGIDKTILLHQHATEAHKAKSA